jgi:hypothetical protein
VWSIDEFIRRRVATVMDFTKERLITSNASNRNL